MPFQVANESAHILKRRTSPVRVPWLASNRTRTSHSKLRTPNSLGPRLLYRSTHPMKCETCKGKGEVYTRIGTDVHIAKCAACEGWGITSEVAKLELNKKFSKFGSVNINELLDE
jgi:hypothetical protein